MSTSPPASVEPSTRARPQFNVDQAKRGAVGRLQHNDSLDALVRQVTKRRQDLHCAELPESLIATQLEEILARLEPPPDEAFALDKRIGEARFLAIGTLSAATLSIGAGLLVHPGTLGLSIWKLRRLLYWDKHWRPRVIGLYVQLAGPDAQVFEAIHFIESQWVIVNYEAYEASQFSAAFGKQAPTLIDITSACTLTADDATSALARLLAQQIIRTDGARYWIPL